MLIKTKNLTKTYILGKNKINAISNITLQVKVGEFVVITGMSGSGKSTLLYQLGLLDRPSEGSIIFNGVETTKLSSKKRSQLRLTSMGYVFQDYSLVPSLNAKQNVLLPLMQSGVSLGEASELAIKKLSELGLKERVNNLPSQLSGGEQQRVGIARALVNDPKVIFADEPTASLDYSTSKQVMDAFKKLNKKGQTIVMITHENEFVKYGGRIIKMKDGVFI